LSDVTPVLPPIRVQTADGTSYALAYKGTISFGYNMTVPDIYYAPELGNNLLCLADIDAADCEFTVKQGKVKIHNAANVLVATGRRVESRIYRLDLKPIPSTNPAHICSLRQITPDLNWLHKRFGHANLKVLQRLPKNVLGVPENAIKGELEFCDACAKGRMTTAPVKHHKQPKFEDDGLGELPC
jgi:hypothetical protein